VLPLLTVQIFVVLGVGATFGSLALGRWGHSRLTQPVHVVARRPPAAGTHVAWIGGTFASVLWPLGVFFVPAYAYHWPAFPDFPESWVLQVFGILMAGSGGVLFARAARALGRHMTPAIQVQQGHQLVQEGPYRLIRHPVYTAIVTVALGQSLFLLSLPVFLLAVVLLALANYRASLEEDLLRSPSAFGGAYDAYMAKTGRFLPRLGGASRPPNN